MYEIFLGNFFWVIILCLDRPRATKIGTYFGTRQRQRHSTDKNGVRVRPLSVFYG